MNLIFTEYVRSLDAGNEPTVEDFDAVWEKLRDALRSEMIKRSLWSSPPSYLGICGWSSWSVEEAFEELLSDCYVFIFVRRLPGLEGLLEIQENIEGVVFRNIRYFLFEKQKQHDPVGYRVFRVLRTATQRLIATDGLHVLAGNPKVGNATILAFDPEGDVPVAPPEKLSVLVRAWADELLPGLVTARGTKLDAVVERLRRLLLWLEAKGIESFRFKDLIDPFKQAVRLRWSVVWESSEDEMAYDESDDELANLVRLVQPDLDFEEREAFHQLLGCVSEALDRLETREKTRVYLETLWEFLRSHAAEDVAADKRPSLRKIAELLNISRPRLPELLATLGRLVRRCLEEK